MRVGVLGRTAVVADLTDLYEPTDRQRAFLAAVALSAPSHVTAETLAAAAEDVERACEHLTAAIDAHRRLGCEPWTVRSQRALENLPP